MDSSQQVLQTNVDFFFKYPYRFHGQNVKRIRMLNGQKPKNIQKNSKA